MTHDRLLGMLLSQKDPEHREKARSLLNNGLRIAQELEMKPLHTKIEGLLAGLRAPPERAFLPRLPHAA